MKNNEMWIIKIGDFYISSSGRDSEFDCITSQVRHKGYRTWSEMEKAGYSCVKIRVEKIKC